MNFLFRPLVAGFLFLATHCPHCCPYSIRIWQLVSSASLFCKFSVSIWPVVCFCFACFEQLVAHVARFQFISCGWLEAPRWSKSKLNAAGARIFVIGRRATNKRCCSHICIPPLQLNFCQQPDCTSFVPSCPDTAWHMVGGDGLGQVWSGKLIKGCRIQKPQKLLPSGPTSSCSICDAIAACYCPKILIPDLKSSSSSVLSYVAKLQPQLLADRIKPSQTKEPDLTLLVGH